MKTKAITSVALVFGLALTSTRAADITPTEPRTIAKEAYIYGFPLVDNYRIQYGYFVDRQNPEFKAPWNQLKNIPRVYTPADTASRTDGAHRAADRKGTLLQRPAHRRLYLHFRLHR